MTGVILVIISFLLLNLFLLDKLSFYFFAAAVRLVISCFGDTR